eukprot:5718916-Prorocentrum_lima.AAC.1
MRAHYVHDLVNEPHLCVEYAPSPDNPADALTKGLGSTTHKKARVLSCLLYTSPSPRDSTSS